MDIRVSSLQSTEIGLPFFAASLVIDDGSDRCLACGTIASGVETRFAKPSSARVAFQTRRVMSLTGGRA